MGDAQKVQAENDIAAKRQVIRAQIDALLEKFPQLKYTDEKQPDHVSGAAAQHTGPEFYPNFQGMTANSKDMTWQPKLHPNPTQSFDAVGPARAGGVGSCVRESNCCDVYQNIYHDESCHEFLYLGGCHLTNTVCNRSTGLPDDDEDTSTSNAAY